MLSLRSKFDFFLAAALRFRSVSALLSFLFLVLTIPVNSVARPASPAQTYTISGQVTDGYGNAVRGVTVGLNGAQSGSTITDANGNYAFPNLQAGGNFSLTPTIPGRFDTLSIGASINNLSSDVTANLQIRFFVNFQIWVKDASGVGIASVGIRVNNEPFVFAQTNSFGTCNVGINVPITGGSSSVTFTPEKAGYVFNPQSVTLSTSAGQTVNFTASVPSVPVIQFSSPTYSVSESQPRVDITVTRAGDTTSSSSVDYATSDAAGLQNCNVFNGIASPRCDYVTSVGTLQFAPGETSKTFSVAIIDDAYAEGNETFTVGLKNASGATLGAQSAATVTIIDNDTANGQKNPMDDVAFFVRQHYIDFLGREPDPTGYAGWQDILNNCGTKYQTPCDRIEVSSDFFRSPEFQARGYFIYRFYSAALGRVPLYAEFMPDLARVSGFLTDAQLEANKVAFVQEFMIRTEFQTKYGGVTDPTAYVDALLQTAGLTSHPTRSAWISGLTNGTMTRATVLRAIVESTEVYQKFYNESFVVMQYFGYLRRDPDILYLDWIKTMNQNGGDYRAMINGFVNSAEYRQRFGP